MFIVEINSNQLMNAGQIPMNRRDHVGVALDRGPWHSDRSLKWQVNSLSRVERIRWRKHSKVLLEWFTNSCSFKVHKTFPRITVNKLPRLPPASISYSPAISLFLRKNLGEKRLYSKIFQWPTACLQQLRHEPDVVNIIDSVTQG